MAALAAIAKYGGFGAAARALGTATGTLSRRVRRLERSLGVTLVATVGERTVVTAKGRMVAEAAARISSALSPYPTRLQLRHLQVLAVVYQEGSITAAAQRLSLPQPALSRLLHRVEDLLGTPAFIRRSTGITATAAALDVLKVLRYLDREQQVLQDKLAASTTSHSRRLLMEADDGDLPAQLTVAVAALPAGRLVAHLAAAFPDTKWQTQPFDRVRSLQDVRERRLNLLVWFRLPDEDSTAVEDLYSTPLLDEPVWLAVAGANPLAAREEVTLVELAEQTWIARPDGPMRRLLDDACRAAGFVPRIGHVTENNRAIRALVAADLGITIASPAIPTSSDVAVIPLIGMPRLRFQLTCNAEHLRRSQALRISTAIRSWYQADLPRSPRYWSWTLTHEG
jgi:DNA-binding transcriptional LysR family regulator